MLNSLHSSSSSHSHRASLFYSFFCVMSQNTLPVTPPISKLADSSDLAGSSSAGVAANTAAENVGSAMEDNAEPVRHDFSNILLDDDLQDAWCQDLEVPVVLPGHVMSDREAVIGTRALQNAHAYVHYMEQSLTFASAASITARCGKYEMFGDALKNKEFPVLLPYSDPSVDARVNDYVSRADECFKEIHRMKRTITQMNGFSERYAKHVAGDQPYKRPRATQSSRVSPKASANTSEVRPTRISRMKSLFSGRVVEVHSSIADDEPEDRTFGEDSPSADSDSECANCLVGRTDNYSPHTAATCSYWAKVQIKPE